MKILSVFKRVENHAELWLKVTSGKINSTISEAGAEGIHVYTAGETCKLLNIAPQTLKHLTDAGNIPYYLMEEVKLYCKSDINHYLLSLEHVEVE